MARIAVIGAGGTGGLYGGLLARAGHDVALLARGPHLEAIRARGLEIRSAEFGTFSVRAPASDDPSGLGQAELVLLAVKTYDLDAGTRAASQTLAPGGVVLTLQNGVDAPDRVAEVVGRESVLIGTTALETTVAEPGIIAHLSPHHRLTVAELDGPPGSRVHEIAGVLQSAGIRAVVAQDGRRALWEKAAFLIPVAALTSVCRASVGEVRDQPAARVLIDDVFAEVAAVARACGFDVNDVSAAARAGFDTLAPTMKASMARDFERGRPTEVESLSGTLLRLAEQHGVPVPVNRAIYAILKVREATG